MKIHPKTINTTLWILCMVLCLAIALFAFNYLILPEYDNLLADLPQDKKQKSDLPGGANVHFKDSYYTSVWTTPNPIKKIPPPEVITEKVKPPLLASLIDIDGTAPNQDQPEKAGAFLRFIPRNTILFASYAKPICDGDGKPIPELTGVQIVEVYPQRVVFKFNNDRIELKVKTETTSFQLDTEKSGLTAGQPAPTGGARQPVPPIPSIPEFPPTPYDSANYSTRKAEASSTRTVWEVDPKERDWVVQNQSSLSSEIAVVPYASGGVKVDSIKGESVFAARGFMPGDVIKSVNGKPVNTIADADALAKDPAIANAKALLIIIDRAGRQMSIEYQLKK